MLTRIITALVALVIFFAAIALPKYILASLIGVVSIVMLYECYTAVTEARSLKIIGYVCGVIMTLGTILNHVLAAPAICIAVFMIATVFLHGKTGSREIFAVGFVTLFITFFMGYIVRLRAETDVYRMLLIFICAWMTDTGAYFTGYAWGKHKLCPNLSPKKTIEGALGGIVISMISCMLYLFVLSIMAKANPFEHYGGYVSMGALGIIASVFAQFGDLAASAIKRDCNIKDYGKIFPGHGGFMDRFDSVIFVAPITYYYLKYIPHIINYLMHLFG